MSLYVAHPTDSVVPTAFSTARLKLRVPRAGDGALVNGVIVDSFETLQRWMPWARRVPTVAESETFAREAAARFRAREDLTFLIFRASDDLLLGATSLHSIDWSVPRFEIGYWLRSSMEGHGYVTEAVRALTALCFERLRAMRVEIRCDSRNERSAAVARRAGFPLEATLRQHARDNAGNLRDTLIFALLAPAQPQNGSGGQRD
jgi:RimJ/RimL family protein N-acetyltransferase